MTPSGTSRAQRFRSRSLWAFSLGGIFLATTLIGLVQYLQSGVVSIRPGHEPLEGTAALGLLATLLLVGVAFAGCGVAMRSCARRRDGA